MRQGDGLNVNQEWIEFDLGQEFDLTTAYIWNFTRNSVGGDVNRSVKQYDIQVADSSKVYATVVTDATLNISTGTGTEPSQLQALVQSNVRWVRFNMDLTYENKGGQDWQGGLSEVRFEGTAVPEPSTTALLGLGGLALILRRRK